MPSATTLGSTFAPVTTTSDAGWLLSQHRIVTTPMVTDEFHGMRITPNVYTTVDEVDLFADRVTKAIRQGLA